MNETQPYIEKAIEEILNPTLEMTRYYLEVCELDTENGKPKVAKVDLTYSEGFVAVYFQVKDENYFIEIHLSKEPDVKVDFVHAQSGHRVYLTATSKILTFAELSGFISDFEPLTGWDKSYIRSQNKFIDGFSRVSFEPVKNKAYQLNDKLKLLLDELEKDISGVRTLSKNAKAVISVVKYQYISGNAGICFDIETINRMNRLNLGIDIDTYIVGEAIK